MTERINEARNSSIRTLDHPAAVLHRPQHRKLFMLIRARGVPPPAVVGNDGEKLRTASYEVRNKAGIHRFVTNHVREFQFWERTSRKLEYFGFLPVVPSSQSKVPLHG